MIRRVAIVGAGIAGTTLAWQLRFLGVPSIRFDRRDAAAASPVAAGLITPVTGLRLAVSWRFDECWGAAVDFYRRVERETGTRLLDEHDAIRLFQSDEERRLAEAKAVATGDHAIGRFVAPCGNIPAALRQPFGGITLRPAGHLHVPTYLRTLPVVEADVTSDAIVPHGEGLELMGERFGAIVFCQGAAGRGHPWFPEISFNPTKGDILTVAIPDLNEARTVHGAGWLLRVDSGRFLAGSTFERDNLDPTPTKAGRDEVERKLKSMLTVPFHVLDHRCGIRPTIQESRPIVIRHRIHESVWCFNGLGSKGSLVAPEAAGGLAAEIEKWLR